MGGRGHVSMISPSGPSTATTAATAATAATAGTAGTAVRGEGDGRLWRRRLTASIQLELVIDSSADWKYRNKNFVEVTVRYIYDRVIHRLRRVIGRIGPSYEERPPGYDRPSAFNRLPSTDS